MSGQSYTLGSSISSTQTTILLSSFKVPVVGTSITMTTMNTSIAYGTLAPGTSQAELISFTGVTQNANGTATLTGVTRGLDKEYPYTESTSFKQPHAGQTIFILSDAPQVFNEYPAKRNDETITGKFTFPTSGTASAAVAGVVYAAPTADNELATKKYVDDTASFGAPNATTATAGIVQMPTQTQVEAGTQVGSTGAQLDLPNVAYGARKVIGYGITAGSANAYTLTVTPTPTAYATGQLVGFQASFTNTGNATLNINGLGAKNIFLGSTGLFAGAIATNAYFGAVYDGTQFDIVEGSTLLSPSASANTVGLRRSTGDMTVPTTPTNSTDAASKAYVDSVGTRVQTITTDVTYASSTAENTLVTTSIVGGILSTANVVRVTLHVSSLGVTATNSWTLRFKYGGTTVASKVFSPTSTASGFTGKIEFLLAAAGTTSSQNGSYALNLGSTNYVGNGNLVAQMFADSAQGTAAIDSTTAQNLVVTSQHSASSAQDNITVSLIVVEKIIG